MIFQIGFGFFLVVVGQWFAVTDDVDGVGRTWETDFVACWVIYLFWVICF